MRHALILSGGTLGFWALVAYPSWRWGGELALVHSASAMALCLIPAIGTLLWAKHADRGPPELRVAAILGGSGVRMAVVLGAGLLLYWNYPETFTQGFMIWLAVFYCLTLTVELILIMRQPAPTASPQKVEERPE